MSEAGFEVYLAITSFGADKTLYIYLVAGDDSPLHVKNYSWQRLSMTHVNHYKEQEDKPFEAYTSVYQSTPVISVPVLLEGLDGSTPKQVHFFNLVMQLVL